MNEKVRAILSNYSPNPLLHDEMGWSEGNKVHAHWEPFIKSLASLGLEELTRSHQEARRILRDNGVTYNIQGDNGGEDRPLELDPIPFLIKSQDWSLIESGLQQRAELLDLILKDIYGSRQLIREGLLPYDLIHGHDGFLTQCSGIRLPSKRELVWYAADIARGAGGDLWVLSDRTQAPSGVGYALENRLATARALPSLFRDCQVHRLSFFFRAIRDSLAELGLNNRNPSRIVVLTPGPEHRTYFEHAYLASYMGFTLAQGADLTVRDGFVWLKTLEGLQQVDIIFRRVNDVHCDPLEFTGKSDQGVVGLMEAARRGSVAIVNSVGSSVLENPGLIPFLQGIAKSRLGEDLKIPSISTWWCGQPKELKFVMENMHKLVIKPTSCRPGSKPIFGDRLSHKQTDRLKERIMANPHLFVGQERILFSTTPSLVNGQLKPRRAILRSFLVGSAQGYTVMPGGLTRSLPEEASFTLANQVGGVSKDTWVLSAEPEKQVLWWRPPKVVGAEAATALNRDELPSRTAENLYWVGRYAERAESIGRLLRTALRMFRESEEPSLGAGSQPLGHLIQALGECTEGVSPVSAESIEKEPTTPEKELLSLSLDLSREGSLSAVIHSLRTSCYAVRDLWSTDTWRLIEEIEERWIHPDVQVARNLKGVQNSLDRLITDLVALFGLNSESMAHELGWTLLNAGRRIERAYYSAKLIKSIFRKKLEPQVEYSVMESALTTIESLTLHRRRYRTYLQPQTVLELLLLDETNPRSMIYQINQLSEHVSRMPKKKGQRISRSEALALEASTLLKLSDPSQLSEFSPKTKERQGLVDMLEKEEKLLFNLSVTISETYFSHSERLSRLSVFNSEEEL